MNQKQLTIVSSRVCPNSVTGEFGPFPQLQYLVTRILVAFLDAHSLTLRNLYPVYYHVLARRDKSMVATLSFVIFANHFPVFNVECSFLHESVCVFEAVENEIVRNVMTIVYQTARCRLVESSQRAHTTPLTVRVINTVRVFARVDANEHGVARLNRFSESG
jgi:hypothetical protein